MLKKLSTTLALLAIAFTFTTHFIIDKYGCKIMLYSSTEKEGVSCS